MADWVQQAQKMVESWTNVQREWWNSVLQASGGEGAADDARRKTIEAWQASMERALDAQRELVRMWATAFTGSPPGGADMTRQAEDMMRRWTESQSQVWQTWLSLAQGAQAPGAAGAAWEEAGKRVVRSLEEAAEKAMEAQAEWARTWGAKSGGDGGDQQG